MKTTISVPLSSHNTTTDFIEFFFEITEKYQSFEQDIVTFIGLIPSFTPKQIFDECNKIWKTRHKLATMDQQMFDILDLAGNDISQSPLLQDYQIAFEKAKTACNHLYQELRAYRDALQTETTAPCSPYNQ